jgi:hypothetical protein
LLNFGEKQMRKHRDPNAGADTGSGLMSGGLIVGLAAALAMLALFQWLLFGISKNGPIGERNGDWAFSLDRYTGCRFARAPGGRAAAMSTASV